MNGGDRVDYIQYPSDNQGYWEVDKIYVVTMVTIRSPGYNVTREVDQRELCVVGDLEKDRLRNRISELHEQLLAIRALTPDIRR